MHPGCLINAGCKLCNTVGSAGVSQWCWSKPGGVAGNYIIMIEPSCANRIYDEFTTTSTVDEIINANASNASQEAKG